MTLAPLSSFIQEGTQPAAFEPVLPGLIVLLPLLGFLINGVLAMRSGARAAVAVRAGPTGRSIRTTGTSAG